MRARPSRRHIGHRLGLMLAAFPTAAPPVYLVAWSRICLPRKPSERLEGACRKLEATSGSVLTIADVLEALRKQEQLWEQRSVVERRDGRIAAWVEKLRAALTERTDAHG